MSLTQEEIRNKLKSIQNRFNSYNFSNEYVDKKVLFIYKDKNGNERSEKEKQMYLDFSVSDHTREIVIEYQYIIVVKNNNDMYYLYSKMSEYFHPFFQQYGNDDPNTQETIFEIAKNFDTILERKYTESTIEFPTGEIIFSNFFMNKDNTDYAFPVPKDLKYSEINSINHSLGEQNTMKILSDAHGLGYVQLGNTSAALYKVNDDKLVLTSTFLYYIDDNDEEEEIVIPKEWQFLGEICCEVWRVEFIDKQNFDKGDTLPLNDKKYSYNPTFTAKVNPGTWQIKNYYAFMEDNDFLKQGKIPVWAELTRKVD